MASGSLQCRVRSVMEQTCDLCGTRRTSDGCCRLALSQRRDHLFRLGFSWTSRSTPVKKLVVSCGTSDDGLAGIGHLHQCISPPAASPTASHPSVPTVPSDSAVFVSSPHPISGVEGLVLLFSTNSCLRHPSWPPLPNSNSQNSGMLANTFCKRPLIDISNELFGQIKGCACSAHAGGCLAWKRWTNQLEMRRTVRRGKRGLLGVSNRGFFLASLEVLASVVFVVVFLDVLT